MKKVQQLDFSDQILYAGIDVHLKSWKVCILTEQFEHSVFSMPPDPKQLSNYLKKHFPNGNYQAAYESGFSGFWAQKQLQSHGVSCIVANAADIPTNDKDRRHKTDRNDCRKIAVALRAIQLRPIFVPDDNALCDRTLIRHRSQIVKDITRVKNRIKSILYFIGIPIPVQFQYNRWSGAFLDWLSRHKDMEGALRTTIDSHLDQLSNLRTQQAQMHKQLREMAKDPKYKNNVRLLMTIPGIGLISAMIWIVELIDIKRFTRFDNLCGYVGLVPGEHSSGEKHYHTGLDNRGNNILRTLLIENTWIAVRKDPALIQAYYRLSKRMSKNKAIIRIARKVLNRIRFVLANQKEYQISIAN